MSKVSTVIRRRARSNPSGNPAGTSGTASAQELHRFPPTNGTSPRRRRMRAAAWGGQRGRCGGAGRTGPVLVHAGGVTALAVRYPRHFTDLPRVRGSPCAARRRHRRATVIVATGPAEPDGGHHGGPVGPRRHGHRGHPSGGPGSERDASLERTPCVTAGTEPGWVTYVLGQVPGWVTYRTGSRTEAGGRRDSNPRVRMSEQLWSGTRMRGARPAGSTPLCPLSTSPLINPSITAGDGRSGRSACHGWPAQQRPSRCQGSMPSWRAACTAAVRLRTPSLRMMLRR